MSAGFPFGVDGGTGIGVTLICIADVSLPMRKAMNRRECKSAERIGEKVSDGSGIRAYNSSRFHRPLFLHPAKQGKPVLSIGS